MLGLVKESTLLIEKQKSQKLSDSLLEKENELERIKKKLKLSDRRITEILESEKYKAILSVDSAYSELDSLNDEIKAKKKQFEYYKSQLIGKAHKKAEKDLQEIKERSEKAAEEFVHKQAIKEQGATEKMNQLTSEIDVGSATLLRITKQVEIAEKKLNIINNEIEIQDELDTIKPVSQVISGINSPEIRERIDKNKSAQKGFIRAVGAWTIYEHYYLNESLSAGKAQQKRLGKFLITAFNAEVDNIISMAKKGNFSKSHKSIERWFEKINELGEDHHIVVEREYLKLRLEELRLVVEYHLQREFEKEEEKYISESIREEKKVQKEIEGFVRSREKEEKEFRKGIDEATVALKQSSQEEVSNLKKLICELTEKLERSVKEKERAMSLAQLTRSGHVYVISNRRSFGEGVYKIGMTRRLDPMDRVRELGDASVPFYFDVHGIIHSDDAPGLEKQLHKSFENKRVNKDNYRREFFKVSLEEIEKAICDIHGQVSLDHLVQEQ